MSVFSSSLNEVKNTRFKAVDSEKKLIDKLNKLKSFLKMVLLTASSDGTPIPEEPTERMAHIVSSKGGPMVERLFEQWHAESDLTVQAGMYHNLSKEMVHITTPNEVNTFSVLFCPPKADQSLSPPLIVSPIPSRMPH